MPFKLTLPGEYVLDPVPETIHIVGWPGSAARDVRTLCGRPARAMVPQDETLSGIMASCGTCKRIFRGSAPG